MCILELRPFPLPGRGRFFETAQVIVQKFDRGYQQNAKRLDNIPRKRIAYHCRVREMGRAPRTCSSRRCKSVGAVSELPTTPIPDQLNERYTPISSIRLRTNRTTRPR